MALGIRADEATGVRHDDAERNAGTSQEPSNHSNHTLVLKEWKVLLVYDNHDNEASPDESSSLGLFPVFFCAD